MFKNQNATVSQNTTNTQQQNFSQEKDFKIEDVPIHTMSQDIYNIEHPNERIADIPEAHAKNITNNQPLTEKQKTSPFLIPTPVRVLENPQPQQINNLPISNTSAIQDQRIQTENLNVPQINEKNATNNNSLLTVIIITIILIIAGVGIYYFLMARQSAAPTAVTTPEPTPIVTKQVPPPVVEPVAELSSTKPNYMPVDIENPDSLTLQTTIATFVKKVQTSAISTPVEFLVVDTKNNPIGFETFAEKLGLKFSPTLISDLGSEFSLFIYNDNTAMRLGLSVNSKNDVKLKTDLLQEEKTLTTSLQNIVLSTDYKFNSATFNTNNYKGILINYINAIDGKNVSVDYTVLNKQLITSTSKMTEWAILDYITANDTLSRTVSPTTMSTQNTVTTQTPGR